MEKREIKFRAWDKKYKQIYYNVGMSMIGIKIYKDKNLPEIIILDRGKNIFELMQYTGIKDKNGKEIYEGDIVLVDDNKGLVVFCSGCFMIEWIDEKESYREFLFFGRNCKYAREGEEQVEVIGNIFENPELV